MAQLPPIAKFFNITENTFVVALHSMVVNSRKLNILL